MCLQSIFKLFSSFLSTPLFKNLSKRTFSKILKTVIVRILFLKKNLNYLWVVGGVNRNKPVVRTHVPQFEAPVFTSFGGDAKIEGNLKK